MEEAKWGSEMTQMTEAGFLREMAAVLERDGWIQCHMHDSDEPGGGHCIMGAAHQVLGRAPLANHRPGWWSPAFEEMSVVARRLGAKVGVCGIEALSNFDGWPIVRWNDAPERTLDEVLALLHECAEDAAREALAGMAAAPTDEPVHSTLVAR